MRCMIVSAGPLDILVQDGNLRITNLLDSDSLDFRNSICHMRDRSRFIAAFDHEALYKFLLLDSLGKRRSILQEFSRRVTRPHLAL